MMALARTSKVTLAQQGTVTLAQQGLGTVIQSPRTLTGILCCRGLFGLLVA